MTVQEQVINFRLMQQFTYVPSDLTKQWLQNQEKDGNTCGPVDYITKQTFSVPQAIWGPNYLSTPSQKDSSRIEKTVGFNMEKAKFEQHA